MLFDFIYIVNNTLIKKSNKFLINMTVFRYAFYHLIHDGLTGADIPAANDIPAYCADAVRYKVLSY